MALREFHRYNFLSLNDLQDAPGMPQRLDTAARLATAIDRAEGDLYNAYLRYRDNYDDAPVWPAGRGEDRLARDLEDRKWILQRYGIKVRANIHIGTNDPRSPFLMINVERLDVPDNPHWVSDAPPGEHYHVSVGPLTEIWKLPDWDRKVKYLYKKFDGKNLWLYPTRVTSGYTLELDKTLDPIASDPIFQELHQTDIRWNEDTDIVGGPMVPQRYVTAVPQPHVSM